MIFIILALLLYRAAIMVGTVAARNVDSNLVTAITNSISAIIPITVIIPILNKKILDHGKAGILWAILGGIIIYTKATSK